MNKNENNIHKIKKRQKVNVTNESRIIYYKLCIHDLTVSNYFMTVVFSTEL